MNKGTCIIRDEATGGAVGTGSAVKDFTYASIEIAERDAAGLARRYPGRTYSVFILATSFRVDPEAIPVARQTFDNDR